MKCKHNKNETVLTKTAKNTVLLTETKSFFPAISSRLYTLE